MAAHEFAIPVRDLDAAGRPYRFPLRSAWLRGALENTEVATTERDGLVDVRLSKSGHDVVIRGKIEAELVLPCARCLEPARFSVREDLSALATEEARSKRPASDEEELTGEDADVIPYDGETVVLDDLVRDVLLLGIPMIPLCSEACPGISPDLARASGDEGLDPRLKPLLRLKK